MTDWADRIQRPETDMNVESMDEESGVEVTVSPVDPGAESVVDEFVDLYNARDLDGIADLLAEDVDAEFVHEVGSAGALDGIEDLFVRQPYSILTRGEVGTEPMAAVWRANDNGYVGVGFLVFEFSDDEEPLMTRIEYVEELDPDEVLVESPDDSEEGFDWDVADLER